MDRARLAALIVAAAVVLALAPGAASGKKAKAKAGPKALRYLVAGRQVSPGLYISDLRIPTSGSITIGITRPGTAATPPGADGGAVSVPPPSSTDAPPPPSGEGGGSITPP